MEKTLGYNVKERNLIVDSEYALKHHPELYEFLCAHPKITAKEHEQLTSQEQQLLLRPSLLEIFQACKLEWRIVRGIGNEYKVKILDTKGEKCQICTTPIRFIFYIRNEISKKELCVGSECITHYEIDKDNAKDFKSMYMKQIKAQMRIQALHKLNMLFPGIQDFVRNKANYLRNNTFVLPVDITTRFSQTYQQLSNAINAFLDNGGDQEKLDEIKALYAFINDQIQEHRTFFEQQENNPWALTTALLRGIVRPEADPDYQKLMSTAVISADSLHLFSDSKFRNRIIQLIADKLHGTRLKVQRISYDGGTVYFDFQQGRHVRKLVTHYVEFVRAYGQLVFDPSFIPTNEEEYIATNHVTVDNTYYAEALSQIEQAFPRGIHFFRGNGVIQVIDNFAFLVFSDSENEGAGGFIPIDLSEVIHRMYKHHLLKETELVRQWAIDRRSSKNAKGKIEDLYDTINAYRRGVVDDKRYVRRR